MIPASFNVISTLRAPLLLGLVTALLLPFALPSLSAASISADDLETAAQLIDDSRPDEALTRLNRWLKRHPEDPKALLLRSTTHFMIGNLEAGKRDLDRSISLDPENRQAWLNRAALALADEQYDAALQAFGRAEALDPSAADNSLNIGAVQLLLGRFDKATDRFKLYLDRNPADSQARYLVASNYAMRGFAQPAVANLKRAIAHDEKARRRARIDPNFAPLESSALYQELLNTDSFQHFPGAMIARQDYDDPYIAGQSRVLDATISSLQLGGRAFDPQVEVTPMWALVWSDFRIKISDNGAGGTQLELSAPPGRFAPAQWQALVEGFLRSITVQLHTRYRRGLG